MPLACDTEATYSKTRDIRSLGAANYVRHPETDHYLVSLWSPDFQWVGSPADCPWERLQGQTLLSHNRSYDYQVIEQVAPPLALEGWHCTADLASYLQAPRSLKDASAQLLGAKVSKDLRDKMKGKRWLDLSIDQQKELKEYALSDARHCWMLWDKFGSRMPEPERQLSNHTSLMCHRGIGLDLERLELGIKTLQIEREKVERLIPWVTPGLEDGPPVTSTKQLALECRRIGIEPPASTDTKSDIFDRWADLYAERAPFVKAMQNWRSVNRTLAVLQAMKVREVDGSLIYDLKYFGAAHTGRWSGSAGLNMQNLPKKPIAGVDCRGMLVPRNGNKLIVADYSQIEARVLLWLVGDRDMLDKLASMDLYEAHARKTMGYTDPRPLKEVDPEMRQFAKCQILGLGFSLGANKFVKIVQQWTGKNITLTKAEAIVQNFRANNPKIVGFWRRLNSGALASKGSDFKLELPSGRTISYFEVQTFDGELTGRVKLGDPRSKLWGGRLCENATQATARELLGEAILRLESAGLPVVLHIHDEIVIEAPATALGDVIRIMQQVPDWAAGCPVSVEAHVCDRYEK